MNRPRLFHWNDVQAVRLKHQGQPLIIPLSHLRQHILQNLAVFVFTHDDLDNSCHHYQNNHDDFCNYDVCHEFATQCEQPDYFDFRASRLPQQMLQLMDDIEGATPGTVIWLGMQHIDNVLK